MLLKDFIHDNPPPAGRKVDEAEQQEWRERARFAQRPAPADLAAAPAQDKVATWRIDELEPNTTGRAEAWKALLDNSGYAMRTSEVRSTVDEQGIRRAEFDMRYRNDQPDIAIIHAIVTNTNVRAAAGREQYAGVSVAEPDEDRAARQMAAEAAALQPHNRDRSLDVAARPGAAGPARDEAASLADAGRQQQLLIRVDEPALAAGGRGQAEAVQAVVAASGASVGAVQSTTDEQGLRHSQLQVSYRTDQPEIRQISQTLDAVGEQPGSQLVEHSGDRAQRHEAARHSLEARPPAQQLER